MTALVKGVGPDAPTVMNERGAKQSAATHRLDLIDAHAILQLGEVLAYGANKYGANNWRGIDTDDHINHALVHLYAHLAGDTQDDHLGHALCRTMMALATHLQAQRV